jgi:hypothetical protein
VSRVTMVRNMKAQLSCGARTTVQEVASLLGGTLSGGRNRVGLNGHDVSLNVRVGLPVYTVCKFRKGEFVRLADIRWS